MKTLPLPLTKTLITDSYTHNQFNSTNFNSIQLMDSSYTLTPPYHHHHHHRSSEHKSRTKHSSSTRLKRVSENGTTVAEPLRISLDLVPSPTSPSPLSLLRSPNNNTNNNNSNGVTMRDLLLLSPSPIRRSKTRFDVAADELPEYAGTRRRCKSRSGQTGMLASPRNSRRSRRRSEIEVREEKEVVGLVDEVGKQRKRRHSGRHNREKLNLSLVPLLPPSNSSPKAEEEKGGELDRVGQLMTDLIMWKDAAKSTLWFGFGSICFLSSCFSKGLNFSIFSAISQLAILFLGISFFSNSVCQRNRVEKRGYAKLTEDDILRLAKLILPALNFAISKTRELFSGEPSMTLKVAPFLLLGANYGHLITIWRLCASAECLKLRLFDTWSACTHKKIVVASALVTFWNLSSVKTRIFTAFILFVILRYVRQHSEQQVEDGEDQVEEKEQQQALVVAEPLEKEPQQALVVAK